MQDHGKRYAQPTAAPLGLDQTQDFRLPDFFRHTRESGYPFFSTSYWIPAYAGMTNDAMLSLYLTF